MNPLNIKPEDIPDNFRELPDEEAARVESVGLSVHAEDFEAAEFENVFVNFNDGTYALGLLNNIRVSQHSFYVGTKGPFYWDHVNNFRPV